MKSLIFDIAPVPKGRPRLTTRGGFARAYTPGKTREFEEELRDRAVDLWGEKPLAGPLSVFITFFIPTKNRKLWGTPHGKRPDIDNFIKCIDAFNGVIWEDDGQIAQIAASKWYAENGCIEIDVEEIDL